MPISFLLLFILSIPCVAAELPVTLGGFIDTYYALDSNAPKTREREFTTQPVRHNEFNVNLAYVDATLKREETRGRLALQFGNSVTKNTVGEPRDGLTSGPEDSKIFQEAYIGKRLGEKTWIDAGIFLGNIGAESWISKDNWTYTRALNLDYVPYYSSGVRIEHALTTSQSVQLQLLNGWQNISENNSGKAIGMQYKNHLYDFFTFTYNNFLGDEEVVPNQNDQLYRPRFRVYHNFILQWLKSDTWQYLASFDVGHQAQQENSGIDGWLAATFTTRRVLDQKRSLAGRIEHYSDPHGSNIATGTPRGFRVTGASVNYDQKLDATVVWRTELRGYYSEDEIFPQGAKDKSRLDGVLVSSFAAWF